MTRDAIRGAGLALLLSAYIAPAQAQEPLQLTPHQVTQLFAGPFLFLAIVAGLVLAIGFQLLLTNVSVAAGVSAFRFGPETRDEEPAPGRPLTWGQRARRVMSGVGLWTLMSASIALFFACWLAVKLSLTISGLLAAVMALVIWALFYMVLTSVEVAAGRTLVGTLMRNVLGGVRGFWGASTRAFSRSDEARAGRIATEVTRAVKEELFRGVKVDRVRDEIRTYVDQLAHAERSTRALEVEEARPSVDEALRVIKDEAFAEKDRVSAIADTALRLSGKSRDEAVAARARVEEWLRSTGKEELDPGGIRRDLERLLAEPSVGLSALRERARLIDRETVEAVLATRSDISPQEAHRIVEEVEMWVRTLVSAARAASPDLPAARERVTEKVRTYLEQVNRPELEYEGIKSDVERLFEEPRVGAEALAERVRAIDRDTVKAILAARKDLTEAQAERILEQVEAARDAVLRRVRVVRDEVEKRVFAARDEAIRHAEEARKTVAQMAWWGVVTAVVSAIAAVAGGVIAVSAG